MISRRYFLLLALFLFSSPLRAGPHYRNTHGFDVSLTPALDRIAVHLTVGGELSLAQRPELTSMRALSRRPDGLTEISLNPEFWGRQTEVIDGWLQAGLIDRVGMVFSVPGREKTFALDREVIIKVSSPLSSENFLQDVGLFLVKPLNRDGTMLLFQAQNSESALSAASVASTRRQVIYALPDFIVPIRLTYQPADPYYSGQWYHNQADDPDISSEEAWDTTMGDPNVIVAVIDTGVDLTHPDFNPDNQVLGYNAVDDSNDPTPLANIMDGHGTACTGEIIAQADNNEGIVGVCPNCSLMGIKMMDAEVTEVQISQGFSAITYAAENNAWVLSNSWGIDEDLIGTGQDQVDITPYAEAVQNAAQNGRGGKGAVVVFASGNGDPYTGQAELMGEHELQNLAEVMAVGGTWHDDQVVQYSDYGPNLSVVAPTGGLPTSMDPPEFSIRTTDTIGNRGFSQEGSYWMEFMGYKFDTNWPEPDDTGNYSDYFSGTSAACPIAAGVVALVFSANKELTGAQARLVVEQTADKVGGVTYDQNGHHDHYGYGRVNAARAVRAAVLGFDNPNGADCAEWFNCASANCVKETPQDPYGICTQSDEEVGEGGPDGQTDGGLDGSMDGSNEPGTDGSVETLPDNGLDAGVDSVEPAPDLATEETQESGADNALDAGPDTGNDPAETLLTEENGQDTVEPGIDLTHEGATLEENAGADQGSDGSNGDSSSGCGCNTSRSVNTIPLGLLGVALLFLAQKRKKPQGR